MVVYLDISNYHTTVSNLTGYGSMISTETNGLPDLGKREAKQLEE
jgi:hypothetical protein